jgi:hypothetical protein
MLAKHTDNLAELDLQMIERSFSVARDAKCADVAVLVRKRVTKAKFLRTVSKKGPSLSCRGVAQIVRAIEGLKDGRGRGAVDVAEAFVCRVLFADEWPTEDEMRAVGVEPSVLRRQVCRLLLQVIDAKPGETWGQWALRTKNLCDDIATACGIVGYKPRLGGAFKANKDDKPDEIRGADAPLDFVWPADLPVEVLTVHEAKGREFDAVLFYCPQPTKPGGVSTCPSETWWAPPVASEEREVAFVAATRAKRLLVLAAHEKTWAALGATQKDFVALFEPLQDAAAPAAPPKT